MKDERKIYIIYLLHPSEAPEIYAWTLAKEMADMFLMQRNQKCFYMKKVILDKIEGGTFMSEHKDLKLIDDVLYDGKMDYHITCTIYEASVLNDEFYNILSTLDAVHDLFIENAPGLVDKYNDKLVEISEKAIHVQTSNTKEPWIDTDGEVNESVQINTFSLFYDLFSYTFSNGNNEIGISS